MVLHLARYWHSQRFNSEDTEQTSQSSMVEIKEVTYGEALLRQ